MGNKQEKQKFAKNLVLNNVDENELMQPTQISQEAAIRLNQIRADEGSPTEKASKGKMPTGVRYQTSNDVDVSLWLDSTEPFTFKKKRSMNNRHS